MNYKTVSAILGIVFLYCVAQVFGLIQPVVDAINKFSMSVYAERILNFIIHVWR